LKKDIPDWVLLIANGLLRKLAAQSGVLNYRSAMFSHRQYNLEHPFAISL
jgi:hypothetical protein